MTISDISLSIFGRLRAEARRLGRHLAMALQLTNICRDVGEDVGRGRIYLPLDELARFGVTGATSWPAASTAGVPGADGVRVRPGARPLPRREPAAGGCWRRDSRPAVRVMGGVYRRVLDRVAADPPAAFARSRRAAALAAGRPLWPPACSAVPSV